MRVGTTAIFQQVLGRFPGKPARIFDAIRGHWGIENKVHHVRDVTHNEDHCRIHTPTHSRVMCSLRNLMISLYQLQGKAFPNYCFRSNPAMHEFFAANSPRLFRRIAESKRFLL
jgi:hypothetical protein